MVVQGLRKFTLDQIKAQKKWAINGGPFGSELVTKDYVEQGVPVIRGGNVSKGVKFSFEDIAFVSEEKADLLLANNAHPGDVIFTQRGTLGQVGLIPKDSPYDRYLISQSQMKLTTDEAIALAEYVYYYFKQQSVVDTIVQAAITSGVPHINLRTLKNLDILLPDVSVQERIVSILSAYDDLIENNTRRIALLEESMRLLYREWFVRLRFPGHEAVKMMDGLPEGWESVTLRDVASYINRGISPKYDDGAEKWVINQKCIRDQRLNLELARRHVTEYSTDKGARFGDVLVNSTGIGTLGRVAQIYDDLHNYTVDSHVTIVRPNDKVGIDYFGVYLFSLQHYFDQMGAGATGQTELSRESVANAQFVFPPLELQNEFGSVVSPQRKLMLNLQYQNQKLAEARDLLLPRLMSGEIAV